MAGVTIPNQPTSRPLSAPRCAACGDFGTVLLDRTYRSLTILEILQNEMPCTCEAGDQWRLIFHEWSLPNEPRRR